MAVSKREQQAANAGFEAGVQYERQRQAESGKETLDRLMTKAPDKTAGHQPKSWDRKQQEWAKKARSQSR